MFSFKFTHFSMLLLLSLILVRNANTCNAQVANTHQTRAAQFLNSRETAQYVLGFVHMGATYRGHTLAGSANVTNQKGETVPGEYALIYDFRWETNGNGNSRIAFLCNSAGKVEDVRVLSTDAIFQQPFKFADAAIQILGNVLLEAFEEHMSAADKRIVASLIRNADSEGLLEAGLMFRQALDIK